MKVKCFVNYLVGMLIIFPLFSMSSDYYTYKDIADTKDDFPYVGILADSIGMNNKGEIAFSFENTIESTSVLYKSDGETLTLIRQPPVGDNIVTTDTLGLGINDSGVIAFSESTQNQPARLYYIFDGNITLLDAEGNYFTSSDINNNNQVGIYRTQFSEVVITDGIETQSDTVVINTISSAAINDLGQVAVSILNREGNIQINKHFVGGDTQSILIGSRSDFGIQNNELGFNNLGNVSYSSDGTVIKEIAIVTSEGRFPLLDTNDGFMRFFRDTSLNNWNQILFQANKNHLGSVGGLYIVDPSGDNHIPVIEVGDVINGKVIYGFTVGGVSTSSLNDIGQVVFSARVADVDNPSESYYALFRADPLVGVTPGNPILPPEDEEPVGNGWRIVITSDCIPRCYIDPEFAIGYKYSLTSDEAPSFESVLIPVPLPGGDDTFELNFNGQNVELKAGTPYYFTDLFPDGIRDFVIRGISIDEALLPDDPTAFVTGLTFIDVETANPFSVLMAPISENTAPSLGALTVTESPIPIGDEVLLETLVTDPDLNDTLNVQVDWGDGTSNNYEPVLSSGEGNFSATHIYTNSGIYTIDITATDSKGENDTAIYKYVVIYDQNGAFVTGGGWFDSPLGAYVPDPSLFGKADFGFVAKYNKGKNVPDGNTRFKFSAGDLNFESTNYQWLIVSGSKAQYKGDGKINDEGDYGFILTANDGDINNGADSFRIKIWDRNTETVIYDNQSLDSDDTDPTTVLGAGNIVIHTSKKK